MIPGRKITLQVGQDIDGFEVKAVTPVDEVRAVAYQLEHQRSGARLLHLHADDPENLFSISFPTPPPDDTGVPHILEHAVLSGSRKYPVRDPFFEMVKMSMATFINAMTGADCTYYPAASNVKQDLFNLANVYFDAVFHPLLTEEAFKREGHHFAPLKKDDPLAGVTINGIVYNEMKGAFSDPVSILSRCAMRGLFPDTIYGRESGGDPESIPDLTYAELKRFHETYYHPSNAYFVLYGDIPTREYLAFLKSRLDAFDRHDIHPLIERQTRWSQPRFTEDTYPVGKDEPLTEKTYILLEWLVGDATDVGHIVAFNVLSLILLGNEAAPLRKAVIDSKLGQDLLESGYGCVGAESTFGVTLKGSEPDRTDAFVKLVLDTLARISDSEIDRRLVDAAFQQAAYHHIEIMPMFPLHAMQRVLSAWIYDVDPLTFLRMREELKTCRRRYDTDPEFFNQLIRELLLGNPHRIAVVLRSDRGWEARTDASFTQRMQQVQDALTDKEIERIAVEAEELERLSATPNSPEALATLPQLAVSDLPPKPRHILTAVEQVKSGVELLRSDVFANGINYLQLDFNLAGLPSELWPYLLRYTEAISKCGAAGMNYEQMAHRVAASTGGIDAWPCFRTHAVNANRSLWSMQISFKALDDQIEPALDVLRDLLFAVDPRDSNRLHDVLIQSRAHYRTSLVHYGSHTAVIHAARGITEEGHLSEIVSGLPQLHLTEQLIDRFNELSEGLINKIEVIRDFLLAHNRLTASFTGSDSAYDNVHRMLSDWAGQMRDEAISDAPTGFMPYSVPPREGLAGPIQVAHCAEVIPAPHYSHPDEPLLVIGARLLSLDYLMKEVRFKGNAYGTSCFYDGLGRTITLGSFRDPHIVRTLQVFAGITDYTRRTDWTQTDIDRAIIGTAKEDERPIRPEDATGLALHRHLVGETPEVRERRYERILSAPPAEVKRALLAVLEPNIEHGAICVVSSREKLEEANRRMPDRPLAIQDILE